MPIYEYECEKCGNKFEILSGYNCKKVEKCPKCKGVAHRTFSPVPIIFKGQGFYVTDSRSKNDTKKNERKTGEKQEPISSTSSKEDGKQGKKFEDKKVGNTEK